MENGKVDNGLDESNRSQETEHTTTLEEEKEKQGIKDKEIEPEEELQRKNKNMTNNLAPYPQMINYGIPYAPIIPGEMISPNLIPIPNYDPNGYMLSPPHLYPIHSQPTSPNSNNSNYFKNGYTTNVYIRGLPPHTSDETLFNMCSCYGIIISSKSIIDVKTNLCKGYGFVMYEYYQQAQYAIHCLNLIGFDASFAKLKDIKSLNYKDYKHTSKINDNSNTNLYVSNLPLHFTEQNLENLFLPYKTISIKILKDKQEKSRGIGLARMIDKQSALAIINQYDKYKLEYNVLSVKFADISNSFKKNKNFGYKKKDGTEPSDPNLNMDYKYHMSPPFYPVDNQHNTYIHYPIPMSPYFNNHYYANYQPFTPSTGELTPYDLDNDVDELCDLMEANLKDDTVPSSTNDNVQVDNTLS